MLRQRLGQLERRSGVGEIRQRGGGARATRLRAAAHSSVERPRRCRPPLRSASLTSDAARGGAHTSRAAATATATAAAAAAAADARAGPPAAAPADATAATGTGTGTVAAAAAAAARGHLWLLLRPRGGAAPGRAGCTATSGAAPCGRCSRGGCSQHVHG